MNTSILLLHNLIKDKEIYAIVYKKNTIMSSKIKCDVVNDKLIISSDTNKHIYKSRKNRKYIDNIKVFIKSSHSSDDILMYSLDLNRQLISDGCLELIISLPLTITIGVY